MKWFTWLLLILVLVMSVVLFMLYRENRALSEDIISLLTAGEQLYIDGQVLDPDYHVEGGDYYLPISIVQERIWPEATLSNSGQRLYVPINKEYVSFRWPLVDQFLLDNLIDVNIPLKTIGEQKYIKVNTLAKIAMFDYGYVEKEGLWIITNEERLVLKGQKKFTRYHTQDMIYELKEKETALQYAVDLEETYFIVGDHIGYTPKDKGISQSLLVRKIGELYEGNTKDSPEQVYLGWDQLMSYEAVQEKSFPLTETGLNVISPTVMELNVNGIILNISDESYVEKAKTEGMQVWALVNNSFNDAWTSEMLNDATYRNRFIAQLIMYAYLYDYEGINVDFENMYLADQNAYTRFLEELRYYTEPLGLILSADVTVPGGDDQWSKVYDRRNMAKHLDYICLMAYDEFWASSPVPGPTASIRWTIEGLEKTLALVPRDKLILGIPGYTRVWREGEGRYYSDVLSIKYTQSYLEENDFTPNFDEATGLNYAEGIKDGVLRKIWLEDKNSIEERIGLVMKYRLAGIALWRIDMLDEETAEFITNEYFE